MSATIDFENELRYQLTKDKTLTVEQINQKLPSDMENEIKKFIPNETRDILSGTQVYKNVLLDIEWGSYKSCYIIHFLCLPTTLLNIDSAARERNPKPIIPIYGKKYLTIPHFIFYQQPHHRGRKYLTYKTLFPFDAIHLHPSNFVGIDSITTQKTVALSDGANQKNNCVTSFFPAPWQSGSLYTEIMFYSPQKQTLAYRLLAFIGGFLFTEFYHSIAAHPGASIIDKIENYYGRTLALHPKESSCAVQLVPTQQNTTSDCPILNLYRLDEQNNIKQLDTIRCFAESKNIFLKKIYFLNKTMSAKNNYQSMLLALDTNGQIWTVAIPKGKQEYDFFKQKGLNRINDMAVNNHNAPNSFVFSQLYDDGIQLFLADFCDRDKASGTKHVFKKIGQFNFDNCTNHDKENFKELPLHMRNHDFTHEANIFNHQNGLHEMQTDSLDDEAQLIKDTNAWHKDSYKLYFEGKDVSLVSRYVFLDAQGQSYRKYIQMHLPINFID